MPRDNIGDLLVFLAVARERSFTTPAARLGVSQSALSHTIRRLEARLGVQLLTRSTRRVDPTEAGERLVWRVGAQFDKIDAALLSLSESRDTPAGTVRITAGEHATHSIVFPRLATFLPIYPQVKVEICVDNALPDIVAQRYDAGVRLAEQVPKDMIAVPIGPPMRMVVVASHSYFANRPLPSTPKDLTRNECINLRLPTHGGLYAWRFSRGGREMKVRVKGRLIFNGPSQMLGAALAGFGLAQLPEDLVAPHLATGHLKQVLHDWCAPFPGYRLYYPSRRQSSPAFCLLVDFVLHRD